jgi:thiaminase/transcriptional activator TenA
MNDLEATVGSTTNTEPSSDPVTRAPGSLTRTLWESADGIYAKIIEHPFLTRLGDGTLEADQFAGYLIQDGHYIRSYTQCLATLAGRAPDESSLAMLVSHSAEAIALESTLHAELLEALELGHLATSNIPASPTTFGYASSLLASCTRDSFLEGLVAMLPCYWIYARVGHHLAGVRSPHPVFARWIENYSGGLYDTTVSEVLDSIDRLGQGAGVSQIERCVERYQCGARYEWMFWDAAYRQERWPV